jgi:alkylation response protein AidB-like acyl-CoA dehydrogenase
MNPGFIPNEEQTLLRDSVRRWAGQFDPRQSQLSASCLAEFADMGWLAAGMAEDVGGLGGSVLESAIIAEELGRALVRAPYVEFAVATAQLLLAVAPERISSLVGGETRCVLAHEELEGRGEPAWVKTRATPDGAAWRLSGRKSSVLGGPLADEFLVSAAIADGPIAIFRIAAAEAPFRAYTTIDERPCGELVLDGTRALLVGSRDDALPALRRAVDHALVVESAEALGAMHRAFEVTRDYLLNRRQYGQRIGDFQALRHILADMFIELEQARSMVLRGLDALLASHPGARALYAAATKAKVAQAGLFIGAKAIQLHGGIGVTNEYSVGHYFKRLLAFNQHRGSGEIHVERFAELRRGTPAFELHAAQSGS